MSAHLELCIHLIIYFLGSRQLFGWTDIRYYGNLGKYWERGGSRFDSKIWWKSYPLSAQEKEISSWDGILGIVNFPRYIVMYSSKEEKKKNCEHKHVSCTFSPNFYNKSGCGLQLNTWETCHKFALINTIHWQYVTLQSTLTRTEKFTMVEIYHFLFVVGF